MRFRLLLLACVTVSCQHPLSPEAYNSRIGVAAKLTNRTCMAIRNADLLPGATITLIAPANAPKNIPVHGARAQILSRGAEACPGTKPGAGIESYNLEITMGSVEPNVPLIALDARVPSVYAAHSFRACNSSDGVKLTAWDGAKPLEGHLLWRQSFEAGQVSDVNCTAAENLNY